MESKNKLRGLLKKKPSDPVSKKNYKVENIYPEIEAFDPVGRPEFSVPTKEVREPLSATIFVEHENFNVKKLNFFKLYKSTDRDVSCEDAINDLVKILDSDVKRKVEDLYEEYKDDDAQVMTSIWTSDYSPQSVYQIVNSALTLDAKDLILLNKNSIKFLQEILEVSGTSLEHVLRHIVKFVRVFNRWIVDQGTPYNTEERMVYSTMKLNYLKHLKEGEAYRMVTYHCTSDKEIAVTPGGDQAIIEIIIAKEWANAARMNEFGFSFIESENETVIPPYSRYECIKIEGNRYLISLAVDNMDYPFKKDFPEG